jgi:hypothetical protein
LTRKKSTSSTPAPAARILKTPGVWARAMKADDIFGFKLQVAKTENLKPARAFGTQSNS